MMTTGKYNNGIIIYSRMGSRRLPGKALTKIGVFPLLELIIRRTKLICDLTSSIIIVATTQHPNDDKIFELASALDVCVYRGHPTDLVQRTTSIINQWELDNFCRVNGDCPLVDPKLLLKGYSILQSGDFDFVTNILQRTFPYGVALEWFRSSTYLQSLEHVLNNEKEHVTKHMYRRASNYNVFNVQNKKNLSNFSFTIDTPEDLKKLQSFFHKYNFINEIQLTYQTILNS